MIPNDEDRLALLDREISLDAWLGHGPNRSWSGQHYHVPAGQKKSVLLATSPSSTATSILNGLEKHFHGHLMIDESFHGTIDPSMAKYMPHDPRFPKGTNRLRSLLDQIIWSRRVERVRGWITRKKKAVSL